MKKKISVRSSDLILRVNLQDGEIDELEQQQVAIPGSGGIEFKMEQFVKHRFGDLKELLGEKMFDEIVEEQGFIIPTGKYQSWQGEDTLNLYYFIDTPADADYVSLVIVSHGEKQPMRYMTHVEGIWELEGDDINTLTA